MENFKLMNISFLNNWIVCGIYSISMTVLLEYLTNICYVCMYACTK